MNKVTVQNTKYCDVVESIPGGRVDYTSDPSVLACPRICYWKNDTSKKIVRVRMDVTIPILPTKEQIKNKLFNAWIETGGLFVGIKIPRARILTNHRILGGRHMYMGEYDDDKGWRLAFDDALKDQQGDSDCNQICSVGYFKLPFQVEENFATDLTHKGSFIKHVDNVTSVHFNMIAVRTNFASAEFDDEIQIVNSDEVGDVPEKKSDSNDASSPPHPPEKTPSPGKLKRKSRDGFNFAQENAYLKTMGATRFSPDNRFFNCTDFSPEKDID